MVEVSDAPDEHRYVVTVDGQPAGFLQYRIRGDVFVALHTEIDPAFGGQGLGSRLVTEVLDRVRESGRRLSPVCPFVKRFLTSHPQYADLATGGSPAGDGSAEDGPVS
jgi:predicted GNAT family acetyltransferase